MDRTVPTLALAGVLLASLLVVGATTAVTQQPDESEPTADETTITVVGTGEVTAEPDRATVTLGVAATGENSTAAAERLAANASELRSALEDSPVVAEVRSTDYNLREHRPDRPPEPSTERESEERQFVASQSFEVVVDEPADAGRAIDLGVANGATEVRGVAFTLSEERHREVRADAIDRAVTDADAQAEAVANSTGLTLGEIRSVRSQQRGFGPVHTEQADAAALGTQVDVRDVTVDASVEVTYDAGSANRSATLATD